MTGLTLTDEVVAPERDVVLEERRMHCDADPGAQLDEAIQATLFTHHPYGMPIIGWGHEIEGLEREDALAYYARFYTPENAILVVAGDVEPEEARALAERDLRPDPPARADARARRGRRSRRPVARRLVDGRRRQGRAAELAALLSRPVLPHRRARRSRSARGARPSHRRRPDQRALSRAGAGGEDGASRPAPITWARRSTSTRFILYVVAGAPALRLPDARRGGRPGAG